MQYKEYNQPKQAHPLRQGCSNYTTLSNRDRPIARNLTPDSQSAFYSADFTVRPIGAPTLPSYHHRPVTVPLMESRSSMREGVKKKKKNPKKPQSSGTNVCSLFKPHKNRKVQTFICAMLSSSVSRAEE